MAFGICPVCRFCSLAQPIWGGNPGEQTNPRSPKKLITFQMLSHSEIKFPESDKLLMTAEKLEFEESAGKFYILPCMGIGLSPLAVF